MISGMPIIWRQDLSFGRWKIMEMGQSLEDYLEAAERLGYLTMFMLALMSG